MNEPTPQLRISAWAIRNPIPVALLFIAAVIAGLFSYMALPIKQYPNIEFPAVLIQVTRSGAAPAEMENQVTRIVENSLTGLSNVESIDSTVSEGASVTIVQFQLGQDVQKVTDDVRSKIDQIRNNLPREIDPPIIQRLEVDSQPIITYAVSAPRMSEADLAWFIDNTVARTLQARPGVAQIDRIGGAEREINVLIDPERLAAQGLTAAQVNDALTQINVDSPGGTSTIGGREQTVRVLGAATSVDAIRALTISTPDGRFVRLSDVADIGDGAAEAIRLYSDFVDARRKGLDLIGSVKAGLLGLMNARGRVGHDDRSARNYRALGVINRARECCGGIAHLRAEGRQPGTANNQDKNEIADKKVRTERASQGRFSRGPVSFFRSKRSGVS